MLIRIVLLVCTVFLFACAPVAPSVQSDSAQRYAADTTTSPVDTGIYTISGTVNGDLNSLSRQTIPAQGFNYGNYGTYVGPEIKGKSYVRIQVSSSNSHLAPNNSIALLKVTDTKAVLLQPGDNVTFRCRHQFEAIGAVLQNEKFDRENGGVWEIDYCRLTSPSIVREKP